MLDAVVAKNVLLASLAAGIGVAAGWGIRSRLASAGAAAALQELQAALAKEQDKRAADRTGRVRAEQKLKQLNLQLAQLTAAAGASDACAGAESEGEGAQAEGARQQELSVYPLVPIGVLRSCFSDRRGTPRQPHLVPAARAALQLSPSVPAACLRGLEGFSHCWVLYVFHENTDLAKSLSARACTAAGKPVGSGSHIKALISVPRLNGGRMGVLATRSPHRPVPIGLSTAQILSVDADAGVLVLGGVDIVDGSPVLDIKPYVPFSDALPGATAPSWVTAAADEEPLALSGVNISPAAQEEITHAWQAVAQHSLYSSPQQLLDLVQQVLSRDIRSLHQRTGVAPVASQQQGAASPQDTQQQQQQLDGGVHAAGAGTATAPSAGDTLYSVTLDGVRVTYSVSGAGAVNVLGAAPAAIGNRR